MFHQFFLAVLANLTSLFVSSLTLFLLPRWLPVSQYNFYQLYLFYAAYLPYLHWGLADGIYLRCGGCRLEALDTHKLSGQFWALAALCLLLAFPGILLRRNPLLGYLSWALLLTVPKIWISYLLQATGKIKEYTCIVLLEKSSYALSIIVLGWAQLLDVQKAIQFDLISRLLGLLMSIYLIKAILRCHPASWSETKSEIKENWLIGSKLMLATISGTLMIGYIRWGIEREWDLHTFGEVSLALSLANLLTILIQSISMVLFPLLKRLNWAQLAAWYPILRNSLMFGLAFLLILYYPLQAFVAFWLPQYDQCLAYLALLFPLCFFESKMSLILNTYLKALRQEKTILKANILALGLSLVLSSYLIFIMHQLTLSVLSIVIVYAFRCIFCEYQLKKALTLEVTKDLFLELGLVMIFILTNIYFNWKASIIFYLAGLIVYLLCKKKDYLQSYRVYRKEKSHALDPNQPS